MKIEIVFTRAQQLLRYRGPFGHNRNGPKSGGCCAPFAGKGGSWVLSNTMYPGPRPTSVPSGILIHPTSWPQYANVTDRQDRQRTDCIGRTVLQTVTNDTSP